jgi:hypothetical protein
MASNGDRLAALAAIRRGFVVWKLYRHSSVAPIQKFVDEAAVLLRLIYAPGGRINIFEVPDKAQVPTILCDEATFFE